MNRIEKNVSSDHRAQAQSDDSLRYLIFSLSEEEFAIPLLDVKEVIGLSATTPIPNTPAYFKGIINLRGQVISIMDLRLKLNLKKADYGPEASIIILDMDSHFLGVIVDSINCVLPFTPEEMSEAPSSAVTSVKEAFIKSIGKKDKRLILNLDIGAILNPADRGALGTVKKLAA
jgi:purine-binding chemotaxis protein CheW